MRAADPAEHNAALLPAYLVPFGIYVGVGAIPDSWGLGREAGYALRLVVTGLALVWAWPRLLPLRGPRSAGASVAIGLGAGLAGTALWILSKAPFYPVDGAPWSTPAFALRLLASGTVVALFEELLFRGFVFRAILQWQDARRAGRDAPLATVLDECRVDAVSPDRWSVLAVAVSTLAFAAGHQPAEYPAAIAYGLLMAGLLVVRRDLLSCVVAHGATNVALAFYVRATEAWGLW